MIKYIVTKVAHEKNPYPRNSNEWNFYNEGYIKTASPSFPSRWEVMLTAIYLAPIVVIAAVIFATLCIAHKGS